VVVVAAATALSLAGPALLAYAIDRGVREGDRAALDRAGAGFLALTLALPMLRRGETLLMAATAERFLAAVRVKAFDRLCGLPLAVFEREPPGGLVARLTSDVEALAEMARTAVPALVSNILLALFAVITLVLLSPVLAAVCAVGLPITVVASAAYRRRTRSLYARERERVGDLMADLSEDLAGVAEIQAFGRQADRQSRFAQRNRRVVEANLATAAARNRLRPAMGLAKTVSRVAVLTAGAALVGSGDVAVGVAAAFPLYVGRLFEPVEDLTEELLDTLQSGQAALSRVVAVIDAPAAVAEQPDATDLPATGDLEFVGVDFAYQSGRQVLSGVTLRVAPGERVALVGRTGAGKSTLAKLVVRAYDPDAGSVRFGGVELRHATMASVQARLALVAQEDHLFAGTLADNVRLARPAATDDQVAAALETLGALERFLRAPDGLATRVSAGGGQLSAGERQLLSLARVVLADPAVVVLDEATSHLDPRAEADVALALERALAGRSVVVIAHRLSSAERAERVLVLEGGRLVADGPHQRLLESSAPYRRLWSEWAGCHVS